jgi:predicted trehalose synthase
VNGLALDLAEILGARTAEMHLALGSETTDPAFARSSVKAG